MNFAFVLFLISLLLIIFYSCSRKKIKENTIWTYWEQGRENIPLFAEMCIKTWKDKNPEHDIIIIDKENVYKYLCKRDLPPNWEKIDRPQHKSDFVRLALLAKYGGIWMDISTICVRPINSVFNQTKSLEGFAIKMFDKNSGLSVFENWFITGKKGSRIIKKWKDDLLKVFGNSTSMEDVDKTYFEGVDLQKIEYGWYLTMHRVMMKLNQLDPEVKELYYNDSKILGAEETAFLHYEYFGWDFDMRKPFLEQHDDFIEKVKLSGTPILKITGSGGCFGDITEEEVLNNKDSVLYKLLHM